MLTRRARLRELLGSREEGFALAEIEEILEVERSVALDDLRHLQMSLRHAEESLLMVPPRCDSCGFTFRSEEPKAPSKCPSCKNRRIVDPVFKVAAA